MANAASKTANTTAAALISTFKMLLRRQSFHDYNSFVARKLQEGKTFGMERKVCKIRTM
ncbi:MAG: hypothetical protein Kow00107_02320 [Planctomycetota bacterium]